MNDPALSHRLHRVKQLVELHIDHSRLNVRHRDRYDQLIHVKNSTAGVDYIGDIPLPLMAEGFEQRLLETPDHLGRIINVEKNRTDRVDPHGPHSMRQYQPPLMGLKRRATVTDQIGRASCRERMKETEIV